MRVTPRPSVAVTAVVVYAAIMATVWTVTGTDYERVADSVGTIVKGIVLTVGCAALFSALFTTWLGWWGPAIKEDRVIVGRWVLIVPSVMALIAIANVASIDFGELSGSYLAVLFLGVALVGFGEELTCRGLALVGMRGRFSEVGSWLLTSLLFGLLHSINVLFGQSMAATVQQMVFAFMMASALYLARMGTGTLVIAMVIHAMWDGGTIGIDGSGATASVLSVLTIPLMLVAVIVAFIAARRVDKVRGEASDVVVSVES
jgi:membrane protease YdiL (CAAX protease family)